MADNRNEDEYMKTHDFWYDLPEELIAQTPLEQRDTSRLLVLDRKTGELEHKHFYDIFGLFEAWRLLGYERFPCASGTAAGTPPHWWLSGSVAASRPGG